MSRISARFAALKNESRAGLITFIMAGDPNYKTSLEFLKQLPAAGADIIEIGMPFSDPMADGPTIQAAGIRSLDSGQDMNKTLSMVAEFRKFDQQTPIVLMGYYNPIFAYGTESFAQDAAKAGVDGVIIVDLPPEESGEFIPYASKAGLDFIRLVAPSTPEKRIPTVLSDASGFVYYISITGITGAASADDTSVRKAIATLRKHTKLPIAVGFGIRTPDQAASLAGHADGVVVGSAIVDTLAKTSSQKTLEFVGALAKGVKSGKKNAA